VDPADFGTAILFGDAASATVLYGPEVMDHAWSRLRRPVLSARGEDGSSLSVALEGVGRLRMDGKRVFTEAVKRMTSMLELACTEAGHRKEDLDLIIPHQANGRIIEAVRKRLGMPAERVVNAIRHTGNTSSSSIPLCLADQASRARLRGIIGLTAFGGGFTFGAAILETVAGSRTDEGESRPGNAGPCSCP
jgi:2-oxoisovalerate dehydrogenase E1 component